MNSTSYVFFFGSDAGTQNPYQLITRTHVKLFMVRAPEDINCTLFVTIFFSMANVLLALSTFIEY